MRRRTNIDYTKLTLEDSLADTMMASMSLVKKKLLMRYKRLKQEVSKRDKLFHDKVLGNFFVCIKKVGPLDKKSEGMFGGWQKRFCVLTNAGLMYFK